MDEIGDFMSSPILYVDIESTVQEAAQYMHGQNVGSLLIKDMDDFVGILTETDITRKCVAKGIDPDEAKVTEIMSSPLLTFDRYLPVEEGSEFMRKNGVRHVAVTEVDKVVGMLSVRDLVAYYVKSFRATETGT